MSLHLFSRINPGCHVLRALFVLGALAIAGSASAAICRVAVNGTDGASGGDWDNVMSLQHALATYNCTEIWLKYGTYKPTTGTDRTIRFNITRDIEIYGGFNGYESTRDRRIVQSAATILSGDIGVVGNNSDNSYHVVYMSAPLGSGITNSTVLDGFTISDGNAGDTHAGGLYCDGSVPYPEPRPHHECSPTLRNITFSDNAGAACGAMESTGIHGRSAPKLINITFRGNSADSSGGAMCATHSLATLTNVTFVGNSADRGGAMVFRKSNLTLTNVTFVGNSAEKGGAIAVTDTRAMALSNILLNNGVIWGNSASVEGGAIWLAHRPGPGPGFDRYKIRDSVIQGGCPTGFICSAVVNNDPLLRTLYDYGGSTETMLPRVGGSAFDKGNNSTCAATDQRGVPRPQGVTCDIGAAEVTYITLSVAVTGNGSVSASAENTPISGGIVDCTASGGSPCAAIYPDLASLTLTATPAAGHRFVAWAGDCSGDLPSISVLLGISDKNCTVSFAANTYTIGGTVSGMKGYLGLQLNDGELLDIFQNGNFSFSTGIASGSSYTVTVATQPSGQTPQTCNVSNATGTVAAGNVNDVTVTCVDETAVLSLSIDDGHGFARYGQTLDYLVTLDNSGFGWSNNVYVVSAMSAGLDSTNAHWMCLPSSHGTCTTDGTGPLNDEIVSVQPRQSVSWLVTVPVKSDTTDDTVSMSVQTVQETGASPVLDEDILVIFRDGFDVANGVDAQAIAVPDNAAVVNGHGSDSFGLPPASGDGIDTIRTLRDGDTVIKIQRLALGQTVWVRLLQHPDKGEERTSTWVLTQVGVNLSIGSVAGEDGQRILILEGASQALSLPLTHGVPSPR